MHGNIKNFPQNTLTDISTVGEISLNQRLEEACRVWRSFPNISILLQNILANLQKYPGGVPLAEDILRHQLEATKRLPNSISLQAAVLALDEPNHSTIA